MVDNRSISQTLVSPASLIDDSTDGSTSGENNDWLTITQPPWEEPPAGGFAAWAQEQELSVSIETLGEYTERYNSQCSEDGHLDVEIQVRKSRPDLDYTISASYGELSTEIDEYDENAKSVEVKEESSIDLNTELFGKLFAKWEGPVYGPDNTQIVPAPDIEDDKSVLSFLVDGEEVEVSGTLRLSYTEKYDLYRASCKIKKATDLNVTG